MGGCARFMAGLVRCECGVALNGLPGRRRAEPQGEGSLWWPLGAHLALSSLPETLLGRTEKVAGCSTRLASEALAGELLLLEAS